MLKKIETIFGPMMAFEGDFITNQIRKFGAHTRPEIAFLLSVVQAGDFVFDLGAHIGTYAIPLAQKIAGTGKLLAVEGKEENFLVLQQNLEAARLDTAATALNALVAPSDRRYAAHTPEGNSGGTYFLPVDEGGVSTATVTIDELCRGYFTPRLMKIDIEGGELFALSGTELLRRERPIVYAEVNNKLLQLQGASIGALEELLRDNGYRFFRNIGARHAAHDNFVVAELDTLPTHLNNFDVLAIHGSDERLGAILQAVGKR